MSLARAFTTRRNRQDNQSISMPAPYIGRAASQRSPDSRPIKRSEISLPVALISTTNMLSYEAPDIAGTQRMYNRARNVSSASSAKSSITSGDESDASTNSRQSHATVTDASSVDECASPQPNHLSSYFKPAVDTSFQKTHSRSNSVLSSRQSTDSPHVPSRAPSHSKMAHLQLSHKRSMQRIASQSSTSSDTARSSMDFINAPSQVESPSSHPFGKELEQLIEVQEEYYGTARDAEAEADRAVMQSRDLVQFCAFDYMQEIAGLASNVFAEDAAMFSAGGFF